MSGGADGKGINYGLISADKTMKILWDFVADETVRGQIRNFSWFDKERKDKSGSNQNANFLTLATYWIWALQEDTQSLEVLPPL